MAPERCPIGAWIVHRNQGFRQLHNHLAEDLLLRQVLLRQAMVRQLVPLSIRWPHTSFVLSQTGQWSISSLAAVVGAVLISVSHVSTWGTLKVGNKVVDMDHEVGTAPLKENFRG